MSTRYYLGRKPKKKPLFDKTEPKKKTEKSEKRKLIERLDRVFALFIRLRDAMDGGYFKCIACGKIKPWDKGQCGHYWGRGHMATRFSEDNCHCECSECNVYSSDHIAYYTPNLIRKIGQSRFDELQWKHAFAKDWQPNELKSMIEHYTSEVKRLSSLKGIKTSLR